MVPEDNLVFRDMGEDSKKKRKKSKKNELSDSRFYVAEQRSNESCEIYEKEDMSETKDDKRRDKEKKKQKKKRKREYSNEDSLDSNSLDVKGKDGKVVRAEDLNGNVDEKVEKKKKKKKKKENAKIAGSPGHRLQGNGFGDADGNDLSTVNVACGKVIQHEKEFETVVGGLIGDLVGKVGKKKRKREKNKGGLDKVAPQQDSTQLTESGEKDRGIVNRECLEKSDEGSEGEIIEKEAKKKRKKDKRKERDGSAAARTGILDKEDYQDRADSTMNEQEDINVKDRKSKHKRKKETSVENGSQDSKSRKSPKKVRFSDDVEVFPSSDVVGSETGEDKETLVQGKRFSKEEDEIVKQAVYNYIEENCLGEDGLEMVMNCKSHPKIKNCWKEITACIPYRPYQSVYYRAHILFQRSEKRKWTKEEKEMVRKLYEQHGPKWKEMAEELGKHRVHVKDTWRNLKLANQKKGRWSQEEYQNLFELVNLDLRMKVSEEKKSKHGMLRDNIPWCAISDKLSTRSDAKCCLKWYNQLTSPMVEEGIWSDADDYRLINALYLLDATCMEDVDWDNLLDHRSGDICRRRWNQMVVHIGQYGTKSFAEQVELLTNRYCPDLLDARVTWDNKPFVS